MQLTVTHLARACGLSRSTVLYYETMGLLKPARRSAVNYRMYDENDLQRLRRICIYRGAGLKLGDIRSILDESRGDAAGVLQRRLVDLSREIEKLRDHQHVYLESLPSPIAKESRGQFEKIMGHKQVTDAYLLMMAVRSTRPFHLRRQAKAPGGAGYESLHPHGGIIVSGTIIAASGATASIPRRIPLRSRLSPARLLPRLQPAPARPPSSLIPPRPAGSNN